MGKSSVLTEQKASGPTLLQLNEDVLIMIVSNLTPLDALRLSVTARDIHLIAKRQVVSSVAITSHKKLAAFCTYMLADIHERFRWLRELTIHVTVVIEDFRMRPTERQQWHRQSVEESLTSARHVADILANATCLKSLDLFPLDTLLQLEPRIGSALSALPDLFELEITQCGSPQSLKVLSEVQNGLRKLVLWIGANSLSRDTLLTSIAHLQSIQSFTLSDLNRARSWNMNPDPIDHYQYSWPAVTDLSISACHIPMPVIVRGFPNVRTVKMQRYLRDSERLMSGSWASLDYAEGPAQFFEDWQITCPIHYVAVTSVLAIPSLSRLGGRTLSGEPDLAMTLQLVQHTAPSILAFSIMAYAELAPTFWTPLVQRVVRLRGLEIDLCEFYETEDLLSVLTRWMETVPPILGPMSTLFYIQITVDYKRRRYGTCTPGRGPPVYSSFYPTEALQEVYVSLVAKAIPSIRYLSVSFTPRGKLRLDDHFLFAPPPWWKVVGTGEGRIVQRCPSGVGERMRSLLISPGCSDASNLEEFRS